MRSSRYAMVIENLKVQNIQEEEETKNCGISSAEGVWILFSKKGSSVARCPELF